MAEIKNVVKRNGQIVKFDQTKILNAITKANNSVPESDRMNETTIDDIVNRVVEKCSHSTENIGVEDIQDMVETEIMSVNAYEVAKHYITYRFQHSQIRQKNTTDDKILSLVGLNNKEAKCENSNKNPVINSTQRDYMAGEVSRDLTRRYLLPQIVLDAWNEGAIHFHDSDYYSQHMHNCFSGGTRFITDTGIREFRSFKDGEQVYVKDYLGVTRLATVHTYGMQKFNDITFTSPTAEKTIRCTADHRWMLKDGSITTDIKIGDELAQFKNIHWNWTVSSIINTNISDIAYCVVEPVTHTFTLEDNIITGNCDLINLDDMLKNGTVITGTLIEPPHSFSTACNIATQIIAQVASNQYGGQSISLTHLAPFVDISRKKIRKEVIAEHEEIGVTISEDEANKITEMRLKKEVQRGVQTIQYQVVTLLTTNGQAPFITVFMYLNEARNEQEKKDLAMIIEETLKQRYQGVKNECGVWVTPAFPKLIYVLEEDNITEDSPYWYLTKLAAKCTAKRMVPDYLSEKKMLELKGDVFTPMGCRSFLTPDRFSDKLGNIANAGNYEPGKHKYYGRFNQGVVTINLPYIAMLSHRDMNKFWEIFDKYLDICHTGLRCRHERLIGTPSDVAPILWQYGALARLKKGETIDKLLYNGYSTLSLGYAGLYECTVYMTGKSHTDPEGEPFAIQVMQHMNDKTSEWKKAENIDYSLYGTPMESTTQTFAKALKKFEYTPEVNDHGYITNSYHCVVRENIDAFQKLTFESKFQEMSPGGFNNFNMTSCSHPKLCEQYYKTGVLACKC